MNLFEINETTTKEDLVKQKDELISKGDIDLSLINNEFDTAMDDLDFLVHEKKFESAIINHKKSGIHTSIFICENGMSCLLREPTVQVSAKIIPYITTVMGGEPDFVKAGKMLVDECWVAGDGDIRRNEDLKVEVGFSALSTLQVKIAKSKKKY